MEKRTDLAMECEGAATRAEEYTVRTEQGVLVEEIRLYTEALAKRYQRERGQYMTVSHTPLWCMEEEEEERVCRVCAEVLRQLLRSALGGEITPQTRILAVGLGNGSMSADALGAMTLSQMTVTRHLYTDTPLLFDALSHANVAALTPDVAARTGIRSAELVHAVASAIQPHAVILIDALAAKSSARLAATVQLSDTGIVPGSGVGCHASAIDRALLKIPVLSVGIPTVLHTDTLLCDSLGERQGTGFWVCPRECDLVVKRGASLLSHAIDLALHVPS